MGAATLATMMVASLFAIMAPAAQAAPFDLDPSFSGDGKQTTDFVGARDEARAIARQDDGKLVAAGTATVAGDLDFAVARYNTDGSLDTTFGPAATGKVNIEASTAAPFEDAAQAVAIQSDGKIVLAGVATTAAGGQDWAVVRLNSDGTLDGSFDDAVAPAGIVITNVSGIACGAAAGADRAFAVIMRGTNILTGGICTTAALGNDSVLVEYNSTGALDAGFGGGDGIATADFSGVAANGEAINALVIHPSNTIVTAGWANPGANRDFAVARWSLAGVLAAGSLVRTDFAGADDEGRDIELQGTKVVVAGCAACGAAADFALARYDATTTPIALDVGFGAAGKVTTNFPAGGQDEANALVVSAGDKLVAAGRAFGSDDFGLARYNANGSPDNTFGPGGTNTVTTDFTNVDVAAGLVLQPDGKLVAAGCANCFVAGSDFALARYIGDFVPPPAADLAIDKQGPASVANGTNFDYTLVVTNNGPNAATGVTVTDTLPAGVTFVSASAGCGNAGGTVTCTVPGSLASAGTASFTITVTAGPPATVTNTATVSGAVTDGTPANNTDSVTTTINGGPAADLSIAKTAPASVPTGQTITYTITVTNNGPNPATGVTVTDTLPAGTTFVSADPGCTNAGGTVTCTVPGSLASGASVVFHITVTANTAGNITNTATVSGAVTDLTGANNTSSATTAVGAAGAANLVVSPTSLDFGDVPVGQTVTRTLTVTNNGPGTATFSQIAITAGAPTFAIVGSTCGATLAANASCQVTVAFTPPSVGSFSGNLAITFNPTINVALTGRGVAPPAQPGGGPQTVSPTNAQANTNAQNAIGGATVGGAGNTGGAGGASQSNSTAGPANGGIGGAGGGVSGPTCSVGGGQAPPGFFGPGLFPGGVFMGGPVAMSCPQSNVRGGDGGDANGTSAAISDSSADGGNAGGGNETKKTTHKSKKSKSKKSKKSKHRRH